MAWKTLSRTKDAPEKLQKHAAIWKLLLRAFTNTEPGKSRNKLFGKAASKTPWTKKRLKFSLKLCFQRAIRVKILEENTIYVIKNLAKTCVLARVLVLLHQ